VAWPTSLVSIGDLISAAQLNALPTSLAKLTGAAASHDFQSIPSFWTHLLIIHSSRSGSSSTIDDLYVRLNNDTGSTYTRQRLDASDSTVSGGGGTPQTAMLGGLVPAANGYSSVAIFIPDYNTAKEHPIVAVAYGAYDITGVTHQTVRVCGGLWKPAALSAVNRVTLLPSASTFQANSISNLYGLGAI
jgi:hypothetical protein